MLRITTQVENERTVLRVEGKLVQPWIQELEKCWLEPRPNGSTLVVDLRSVTVISGEGKELLGRMHQSGAKLVTSGVLMNSVLEQLGKVHAQGE